MIRVAFVLRQGLIEQFGVLHLCGMLKRHSYAYDIFLLSDNCVKEIQQYSPDIVAYNTVIGTQHTFLEINRTVKKILPNVFSVFGGHYPTLVPEMIQEEGVDAICVGEGDYALLELVQAMDKGEEFTKIKNLHFKIDGEIVQNPKRHLIEDLDSLPFADREVLYRKNPWFREGVPRRFLTKRGCPFNCSYCFNDSIRRLYKGLGKHFRVRGVDCVVREMEEVTEKYPSPIVSVMDDTFTFGKADWVYEFAEQYRKRVGLPLVCTTRVGTFDYETMRALKDAGLYHVFFGVETANEELRKRILRRQHTNKQIIEATEMLRELGIKYTTLNMLGLPEGGYEEALRTLEFNQSLKPHYAMATVFQPYPGSSISEYIKEHGYLAEDAEISEATTLFSESRLKFGNPEEGRKILALQRIFALCVGHPALNKFIPVLVKMPESQLVDWVHRVYRGLAAYGRYKKGMSPKRFLFHGWHYFLSRELF
ncbi:MAG: radical SAM protein [Pseudomonadota bacterium]